LLLLSFFSFSFFFVKKKEKEKKKEAKKKEKEKEKTLIMGLTNSLILLCFFNKQHAKLSLF